MIVNNNMNNNNKSAPSTGNTTASQYNLNEANFHLLAALQQELYHFRNVKFNFIKAFDRAESMNLIILSVLSPKEKNDFKEIKKYFERQSSINNNGIRLAKQRAFLDYYITKQNIAFKRYKISMTDKDTKLNLG